MDNEKRRPVSYNSLQNRIVTYQSRMELIIRKKLRNINAI